MKVCITLKKGMMNTFDISGLINNMIIVHFLNRDHWGKNFRCGYDMVIRLI